jgi:anti-sigma-K factor RskA
MTSRLSDNDNILAAEYALGLLPADARRAFEQRLKTDSALAAALRDWDEHFTSFADEIAPVEPPKQIADAIEKRLFATAAKPSLWNSLGFWRGFAMASVAAAIMLGAWNLRPTTNAPDSGLVAQLAGDANAVKLVAYYDEAKGELRLNRTEGAAAAGRSLELWLIAGQDAPVSLGLLPVDTSGKIIVAENLRAKLKGGVLAISDEPPGGSPTKAPTGAVLATGQLTAI